MTQHERARVDGDERGEQERLRAAEPAGEEGEVRDRQDDRGPEARDSEVPEDRPDGFGYRAGSATEGVALDRDWLL